MENNKFRDMTQVPANGAVEDELKVQDVDAGAPGLSEEDSAKIDEIVETLEAEESVEEAAKAIEPAMSEADMRKAQVAETEQAIEKANQEIATSKEVFSRASKERADAKKALANQKKQVKEAIRKEKRQKRQEAATKSKEERHAELERRKAALVHTTAEMSTKMKQLLSGELKSMEKRKKTRAAEIMAVFAKHNFYANGFTPVELRTTLEDLGPTYVKIGQIMSSR
ncbi:MAG: hypothetical protein Q4D81_08515, partial [Eubacteriales bacterium]|nr:hypothetical protein [Eubacteriales bacterium]